MCKNEETSFMDAPNSVLPTKLDLQRGKNGIQ